MTTLNIMGKNSADKGIIIKGHINGGRLTFGANSKAKMGETKWTEMVSLQELRQSPKRGVSIHI